uniref:Uncharacterized protein n=1 Tax=Thermosporothrix sp. COM3 TaxID=2490863 RepID=A0A455SE70_9CHLR|nr:hypothetical protein KTC_00130 [Thermosporothrix sp. COM3]
MSFLPKKTSEKDLKQRVSRLRKPFETPIIQRAGTIQPVTGQDGDTDTYDAWDTKRK